LGITEKSRGVSCETPANQRQLKLMHRHGNPKRDFRGNSLGSLANQSRQLWGFAQSVAMKMPISSPI
jgi:hypothetical protein